MAAARPARRSAGLASLPVPVGTAPMEAKLVDDLPSEPGWQFEPKWDGFRCLAFRAGDEVDLRAKSGKPLARYFPEVAAMLRALAPDRFVIDGELAIPDGDTLSFDALQMRLHPAESRIRKLSVETPAILILFDCLMTPDDEVLLGEPLAARREALETLFRSFDEAAGLRLSPYTRKPAEARKWLAKAGGSLDGVIAKRLDGPYVSGERAMLKVKRLRSADCVVGGFRYATNSDLVGSLLLGLYNDEGKLDHVGFTSTISNAERAGADEAAREAQRGLRASPATPPAVRAAGRPSARPNGCRSGPSSSSRCATTTSPAAASATAPSSCAGGPTRRRSSAPSSRCRRRPARVSSSARSWRREWQKTATRSRSRACG